MKINIHTKGTMKSMAAVRLSTSSPISNTDAPVDSQGIDSCQVSSHTCSPDSIVASTIPQEIIVEKAIPPMARLELRRLFGFVKRIIAANTSKGTSMAKGARFKKKSISYLVMSAFRCQ